MSGLKRVAGDDYVRVLELELDGDGSSLQPGYSGSPVLIQRTRRVIGVVDQRKGDGKQGLAISVEEAKRIFQRVPELHDVLRDRVLASRINLANWLMDLIEKPLRWPVSTEVRDALDWLSDTTNIAKQAGDYALENSQELQRLISNISDQEQVERIMDDFYWEIEKYLERIYVSLLTHSFALLDKPDIRPSLPSLAYEAAFTYIKEAIPEGINNNVAKKIKKYIDTLLPRLYLDN